jgi:hypothetical protein
MTTLAFVAGMIPLVVTAAWARPPTAIGYVVSAADPGARADARRHAGHLLALQTRERKFMVRGMSWVRRSSRCQSGHARWLPGSTWRVRSRRYLAPGPDPWLRVLDPPPVRPSNQA